MGITVSKFSGFRELVRTNSLHAFALVVMLEAGFLVLGQLFTVARICSIVLPFRLMSWAAGLRYVDDSTRFSWKTFLLVISFPYLVYGLTTNVFVAPLQVVELSKIPFWLSFFVMPFFIGYVAIGNKLKRHSSGAEVAAVSIVLLQIILVMACLDWLASYWSSILLPHINLLQQVTGKIVTSEEIAAVLTVKTGYLLSILLVSNFLMPLGAAIALIGTENLYRRSADSPVKYASQWLADQMSWTAFWFTVGVLFSCYAIQLCGSIGLMHLSTKLSLHLEGIIALVRWLPSLYGLSCVHARIVSSQWVSIQWQFTLVIATTFLFYIMGPSAMMATLGLLDRVQNLRKAE